MAKSRQKCYEDCRLHALRFSVGDRVFLCVLPMKGVITFGRRGKLRPRYIRPFEILCSIRDVNYKLALPPDLSIIHPIFHLFML